MSTDDSAGDRYMRCPKCGLPFYDQGLTGKNATCQCNNLAVNPNNGWMCPRCNKVYSPSVDECSDCNSKGFPYITTTNEWDTGW